MTNFRKFWSKNLFIKKFGQMTFFSIKKSFGQTVFGQTVFGQTAIWSNSIWSNGVRSNGLSVKWRSANQLFGQMAFGRDVSVK
jgi:hypothetical protein